MEKAYNAKLFEDTMYKLWENSGSFSPASDPKAKPFTIIMPPPNANDPLHIGHAMFITIEDILIRYHRMKGDASLWVPGADHAGIETQFVFEKKLKKEGKSRFDFDRETLFKMIWDYVQTNTGVAKDQMKKIGASADWSRFTFTLNPDVVNLVLQTFFTLHERNMVYRDLRLINYCTRCGTGYSELEAKHELKKDPLIYMKYGPFVIATVRPETKFRDTALAVNPNDKRYKQYIGQTFEIQGLLGPITMKVVEDTEVDPEFGTGIMKVTPAHDFHDFELGKIHNLPVTPIIDFNGKMDFSWYVDDPSFSSQPEKYQKRARRYHKLHISKARPMMIEDLKADGLIDHIDEAYEHTVATCYRCGTILEPLPLPQFYLKVKPMTEKVLTALKDKKVKIHGPGYDKILKHWLTNLKDWNISRQIVWGIRIPVWYSAKEYPTLQITLITPDKQLVHGTIGELTKNYSLDDIRAGLQSVKAPIDVKFEVSQTSPGNEYIQETDTFDTWFSSGQWPFVTLKVNPQPTTHPSTSSGSRVISRDSSQPVSDFERFYPTQVMETAYDILIFWVMRMLMMGLEMTGNVPFEHVYLHGLVRDEKGQKMSKSKGNVINPIDVIDKYGADALRMALVMSTTAGKDSNTGDEKIRGMRNFTNKIWNAARFIEMKGQEEKLTNTRHSREGGNPSTEVFEPTMDPDLRRDDFKGKSDQDFKKHIQDVVKTVTKQLDTFKIGLAAETVYQEFWHYFCDEAIEKNKTGEISTETLKEGLQTFLRLLHPFVPFVTEAIWQQLPEMKDTMLISSKWPKNK